VQRLAGLCPSLTHPGRLGSAGESCPSHLCRAASFPGASPICPGAKTLTTGIPPKDTRKGWTSNGRPQAQPRGVYTDRFQKNFPGVHPSRLAPWCGRVAPSFPCPGRACWYFAQASMPRHIPQTGLKKCFFRICPGPQGQPFRNTIQASFQCSCQSLGQNVIRKTEPIYTLYFFKF
jgi:hypothetical protein